MSERRQFGDAIVEGPLDIHCAPSRTAAERNGVKRVVTGDVDIYLVPEIDTGYLIAEALVFFGKNTDGRCGDGNHQTGEPSLHSAGMGPAAIFSDTVGIIMIFQSYSIERSLQPRTKQIGGDTVAYKILGISGSPKTKGNVSSFMAAIMEMASEKGFDTETVYLSKMNIKHCIHCNYCIAKQKENKYCSLEDDAQAIFEKLEQADVILLASPVYFMRTSGMMATFLDRLRVFIFGNVAGGKLRNKIGISAAVSWMRHGGMETTHLSHILAFITLDMIPATVHSCISPMGAAAVSSINGQGVFDPSIHLGILQDQAGLDSAKAVFARAVELLDFTHYGLKC